LRQSEPVIGGVMTSRVLAVPLLLLLAHPTASAGTPGDGVPATTEPAIALNGSDQAAPRPEEGSSAATPSPGTENAPPASATAPEPGASVLSAARNADLPPALQPRARAFEYSDAYRTRLKIHRYASVPTLPLFLAQYAVGQKLYNGTVSNNTRSLHSALAVATGALFAVNTVTGVWNLSEGHKDPNHRTKKMLHGILMLVADGGFAATGALAPHLHRRGGATGVSPATHRAIALTSMGVATVSYAIMLFHH
jgi:hypothetical protein